MYKWMGGCPIVHSATLFILKIATAHLCYKQVEHCLIKKCLISSLIYSLNLENLTILFLQIKFKI